MTVQEHLWVVADYDPVSLFSLRMSNTTSKGGKTLVVPTPYAVKMALIDACFRVEDGESAGSTARSVFELLKRRRIRFLPPRHGVVQNTFVKVLDAERDGDLPFKQTIVYREFAAFSGGPLSIAVDAGGMTEGGRALLRTLFWHINSLGKRGSFLQCLAVREIYGELPVGYSATLQGGELVRPERYGMLQMLDDFGEDLCKAKDGFDRISTYGEGTITLGKHRVLATTALPYHVRSASKRHTWYERIE